MQLKFHSPERLCLFKFVNISNFWEQAFCLCSLYNSIFWKVPVVRKKPEFELQGLKYLKICSQGWFWDFTYFEIINAYSLSCLNDFDVKSVFMFNKIISSLPKSQALTVFFSKSTFWQISNDIINRNTISQGHNFMITNIFAPQLSWKNSHLEN